MVRPSLLIYTAYKKFELFASSLTASKRQVFS